MSVPEPLNPNIPNARRLAREFTPQTPFHHPHLDPNLDPKDLHLVPKALFPGRKLNWELPRPAVANLHIHLQLTNNADEIREEFQDKIPQVDDVLGLWGELKGASLTTTGEAQLQARTPVAGGRCWTSTDEGKGTTSHLIRNLDTPGRADVVYLTDAVRGSVEDAKGSNMPSNLRSIDCLGSDGSYVHLEASEPKMPAFPTDQGSNYERRDSTPSNLRVTEWPDDEQSAAPPEKTYNSEPRSDVKKNSKETGPYETFWIQHDPYGPQLALRGSTLLLRVPVDEGDTSNSTSQ